jgi:hypothetical protein
MGHFQAGKTIVDPSGQLFGLTGLGGAEQNDELFPAVTGDQIGAAPL